MTGDETCAALDWLSRARAGDVAAFATLVRQHQRLVYSLALRMLADRYQLAMQLQEHVLRLHRKLVAIESAAHLKFWLRKVTTHLAIDRLRQEHRHEAVPLDDEPGIECEAIETDPFLHRQLHDFVAQLAPAARAVVVLRFQEDMDPSDIAETLDMSVNTVKSHLRRSLEVLREKFAGATGADAEAAAP